ncbi:MAG: hypothetical protein P8018_03285 [Acidobacteriota bacterium]
MSAFLAGLAEAGGIGASNNYRTWLRDRHRVAGRLDQIGAWMHQHMGLVITIVAVTTVLSICIGLLFLWLGSRGRFMFLEGVVRDRAAVAEPWRKFRRLGNSLFFFRIFLALMGLLIFGGLAAACVGIAGPGIFTGHPGPGAIPALLLFLAVAILVGLVFLAVRLVLKDFVVPIMYHEDLTAWPAFGRYLNEILRGHFWITFLFYLLKLIMGVGIGIVSLVVILLTCCIAGLPYVSSVVFLPFLVFMRCYSVFFLEQFGERWLFFRWKKDQPGAGLLPGGP